MLDEGKTLQGEAPKRGAGYGSLERTEQPDDGRLQVAKLPDCPLRGGCTVWWFVVMEFVIIAIYALFSDYSIAASGKEAPEKHKDEVTAFYGFFQDVHVMIFIGFGFLMTFMRRNAYSAVGFNLLVAAFAIQWYLPVCHCVEHLFKGTLQTGDAGPIRLSIENLITADFCTGAVLISYGALLGKVSILQMLLITFLEVVFFTINEQIGVVGLKTTDLGGSITIHLFGSLFGCAASLMMSHKQASERPAKDDSGSVYHADVFAMIGTIFLWMFWPSFNGALGVGNTQHRAIINTIFSIAGSCVAAFLCSYILRGGRFQMDIIQNATLAGGVGIGTCADLLVGPGPAIGIGVCCGTLSTLGFAYVQPWLLKKIGLHDSCGVNNLHGMPGLAGALAGVLASGLATIEDYGEQLILIFPARGDYGQDRTRGTQALCQLYYMLGTMGIAVIGGVLAGWLARGKVCGPVEADELFLDSAHWEVPENEIPYYFAPKSNDLETGLKLRRGAPGTPGTRPAAHMEA